MKIENKDLSFLLGLANDLRIAKGDDILEDLPVSTPEDTGCCLVANAFNYGCEVIPYYGQVGTIIFESEEDLSVYLSVVKDAKEVANKTASLPSILNEIASDFDNGAFPEYATWNYDLDGNYLSPE